MALEFEGPFLLLVEGMGDRDFFLKLIAERHIAPHFDVVCPTDLNLTGSGNTRFGEALTAITGATSFHKLQAVLIATDSDTNRGASFANVREQVRAAGYPVPTTDGRIASAAGYPKLAIVLLPREGRGNLETVCLAALEAKFRRLAGHLDEYARRTKVRTWPLGKRHKMRVTTLIASTCKRKPDGGLGWYCSSRFCEIDFAHQCFDSLTAYLQGFERKVNRA